MKLKFIGVLCLVSGVLLTNAIAHDLHEDEHADHKPHYDYTIKPPTDFETSETVEPIFTIASYTNPFDDIFYVQPKLTEAELIEQNEIAMTVAEIFRPFAPKVKVHWDDKFFYVESDGFPNHPMMIGITAWQQQVPIPQKYFGNNAWRFPLQPIVAKMPLSAKDHFFRGAIAIAANGVPIFNPIKNDGRTDTFLAGELDKFGGHAGRSDDYHYHIAPLHLQEIVGKGKPIAYALDGYPIYGLTESDGLAVKNLDSFNGHTDANGNYHYHSTKNYPYINGGFHGEVVERDGQVDPQPRANGVRPATEPLRGAKITDFILNKDGSITLTYTVSGETRKIVYAVQKDGSYRFEFVDGNGKSQVENYSGQNRGGGGENRPPRDGNRPPRDDRDPRGSQPRRDEPQNGEKRIPWIIQHASEMDANHDGELTKAELLAEVDKAFSGYDSNKSGKIESDEVQNNNVRSALGGFVKQHRDEIDANHDSAITKDELLNVVMRMFSRADQDSDGKLSKEETKDATPLERPKKDN
ncbi:MAG TPA: YHYH protein [Pyrinomonadaceae bacterium]|nr:YHYH protein [Pyrinomonadaceae bacterium]